MAYRLLCGFLASGASFAAVSHDQRLKLFSTATGALTGEHTDTAHLSNNITAIAFPPAPAASAAASAKSAANLIALGTAQGEILLWNTRSGQVVHRIGSTVAQEQRHAGAVNSIAFHPSGSFLFSASADQTVKQWQVSSGAFVASFLTEEKTSFSRLTVAPSGELLAAGGAGSLVLWDLSTPRTPVREYSGPTNRLSCVAFSPDSKYLASGSGSERFLTIWTAELDGGADDGSSKKKKKHKSSSALASPVHTFTLPTPPLQVQFNQFASAHYGYQLASLGDSSVVAVMQWNPAAAASAASTAAAAASSPTTVIRLPAASGQSEASKRRDHAYNAMGKNKQKTTAASSSLLAAGEEGDAVSSGAVQAFAFDDSGARLTLARGDAVRPVFEVAEFRHGGTFQSEITLPAFKGNAIMNAAGEKGDKESKKRKAAASVANNEAVTLGAQHMTEAIQSSRSALDGQAASKRSKLLQTKSKSDALSRSLAERLAESESQANLASGVSAFNLANGELPKAGSLQTILQQALHSNDVALVEYCLTAGAQQTATNSNLIRASVKRLPSQYVLPLLTHLMSKFASRPNRSAALLPWLREVFKSHTGYLLRQPNLQTQLAPLYHLLDTRLSVFNKLLKLQGRLELLLSQISTDKADAEDADDAAAQGPLHTFNDGEDADGQSGAEEDDAEDGEEEDEEGEDNADDDDADMADDGDGEGEDDAEEDDE